jgi:large subunit ribosomal protein L15
MKLHELSSPKGARKPRRRLGRGLGSGRGTTAGKGTKGQKARSGGSVPLYFEGGQLPLVKRLPYRRGFVNRNRIHYRPVNLDDLSRFDKGSVVGPAELIAAGLLDDKEPVKILGDGELSVGLTVRAHRFSRSARERIEAAGGTVEEIPGGNAQRSS